jgi:uncharacterized repeat protein (TIGR03803 family)
LLEPLEERMLPSLLTLASFDNNGYVPQGLLQDSSGNLFGTMQQGGAYGDGAVFELAAGSSTVITLAAFDGSNGAAPNGGMVEDASGNLFGTTQGGQPPILPPQLALPGTVFELPARTGTINTLAYFATSGPPIGGLVEDSRGDFFGTTRSTVFEMAAGSDTVGPLASFSSFQTANGFNPVGSVVVDSSGNVFGTTESGGAFNDGTVFEVVAGSGTATVLASFNGANGADPQGGLLEDPSGNLFGTTPSGGAFNQGTVFELAAGSGAITTLASFNGALGANPQAGLIEDARGNLYGTAASGGGANDGTVFEVPAGGGSIRTVASFNGANGATPQGGLIQDKNGNLLGTTLTGGTFDDGTVFEVPNVSVNLGIIPGSVPAGIPFTVTVTAENLDGSTATGYRGTVHFASSDSQATLPPDYTFTAADAGTHAFTIVLPTLADQTVTVWDTASPTLTTTAGTTVVPLPGNLNALAAGLVSSPEYFTKLVANLYQQILHRSSDPAGSSYWVSQLKGGMTDEEVEANLCSSAEYIASHGGGGSTWLTGLYHDLLDRMPDAAGLSAWTAALAAGESFYQVALAFATSAEHEGDVVIQDYEQFLERSPSAAEVSAWVNAFGHGGLTNEAIIADFLSSAEFFQSHGDSDANWFPAAYQALLGQSASVAVTSVPSYLPAMATDLTHSPLYYTEVITAAYEQYLGRQPDSAGLAAWLTQMETGLSDGQFAAGILSSNEYVQNHGGIGSSWIEALYHDVLGRTPSTSEVNTWMQALAAGVTPSEVALAIVNSPEHEGQLVTHDYEQFLGRSPSASELGAWVAAFETGGLSNEDVVTGFLGSAEYFQRNGSVPGQWWNQAVTALFGASS